MLSTYRLWTHYANHPKILTKVKIPSEITWIRIPGVVQESTSLSSISEKFWSSFKVENPYGRISISGPTQFLSSVPSPAPCPTHPPAVCISATLGAQHKCHLPGDTFQDTPQVGQVHWNPSLTAPCVSLPAEIQCQSAEKWYTAHLPRERTLCKGGSLLARPCRIPRPYVCCLAMCLTYSINTAANLNCAHQMPGMTLS